MATRKVDASSERQIKKVQREFTKHVDAVEKVGQEQAKRISQYRREVSRLASVANKRIERLEKNGLTNNPAYQYYIESGKRFGVKGKTYNEVQAEAARLRRFVNMESSTIGGMRKSLQRIADNTGIKYSNIKDLQKQAANFFEIASKAEQYLTNVRGAAASLSYNAVWSAVNEVVDEAELDLSSAELDLEQATGEVIKALDAYTEKRTATTALGSSSITLEPADIHWFES